MEDEEVATIVIDGKSTNKIGEDLKMPKFDDSVSYTELTETDLNTIMNNLSTNKNLVKFITKISTYTSSSTTY